VARICQEMERIRIQIERRLADILTSAHGAQQTLHAAIRHSLLAPGKRLRPVLMVMTATQLGCEYERAIDPACAVEMVHTASLILDDLPSMDDAVLRRGRPANHVIYGEDMAVLAAFALLTRAYEVIAAAKNVPDSIKTEAIGILSRAVGPEGTIGGQELDLCSSPDDEFKQLMAMHEKKTGALFVASAVIGARLAKVADAELVHIERFAKNLGLAFQVIDDFLDATGNTTCLGKDVAQDIDKGSFVSLLGVQTTIELAEELIDNATQALAPLGERVQPLIALTRTLHASIAQPTPGAPARAGIGI
jgi:geranylgeranyl diphosphate synthase type II